LLAAKIQHPVLTDLRLEGGPVEIDGVYPVRIPDVFAGEELVLFGRFSGEGQSQITIRGERQGEDLDFSTEMLFPETSSANDYIPRLWASRKLGHLERQVWTEGMTEALAEEIRSVALRYGLPSRFTAYLVQEPDAVVAQQVPLDASLGGVRGTQGGNGSGGVIRRLTSRFVPGKGSAPSTASAPPTTGEDAVSAATSARRMRSMTSTQDLAEAEDDLMNEVMGKSHTTLERDAIAGRIFELRDELWTDVSHRSEARLLEVKIYSAAWFSLLETLPELESVLRTHESVVIAGASLSVQVGAEGAEVLDDDELVRLAEDFRHGAAG